MIAFWDLLPPAAITGVVSFANDIPSGEQATQVQPISKVSDKIMQKFILIHIHHVTVSHLGFWQWIMN